MHPIMRTGPKGSSRRRRVGGDETLSRVAFAFTEATARHGAEAWLFNSAGAIGPVSRDGLQLLTHVMGYSRPRSTICAAVAIAR